MEFLTPDDLTAELLLFMALRCQKPNDLETITTLRLRSNHRSLTFLAFIDARIALIDAFDHATTGHVRAGMIRRSEHRRDCRGP